MDAPTAHRSVGRCLMYVAVVIAGCLYCTVSVAAAGILAYRNMKG